MGGWGGGQLVGGLKQRLLGSHTGPVVWAARNPPTSPSMDRECLREGRASAATNAIASGTARKGASSGRQRTAGVGAVVVAMEAAGGG